MFYYYLCRDRVYKTHIISTIVDKQAMNGLIPHVYKTHIISTIVDNTKDSSISARSIRLI